MPPCPLSPGSPVAPVKWTERTGKDNVTLDDRDAAACLLLPRHLAGSLLWARGWQGFHQPNPIHHREEKGTLEPVFSWLVGREGASAPLFPASSSNIKIHQQPPALCPPPHHCPAKGTRNSPSVCPLPTETVPAVLALLFVEGCPCHRAACCPSASRSCSAPLRMPRPPQFPLQGVGFGSLGGSRAPVCICLHRCLSCPSSLMLLHLLRNP